LLTRSEEIELQALKFVCQYLVNGTLPDDKVIARSVCQLASAMELKDDKVWPIGKDNKRVEVLDTLTRLKEVLVMLHDSMGHRALGSCYSLFQQRF